MKREGNAAYITRIDDWEIVGRDGDTFTLRSLRYGRITGSLAGPKVTSSERLMPITTWFRDLLGIPKDIVDLKKAKVEVTKLQAEARERNFGRRPEKAAGNSFLWRSGDQAAMFSGIQSLSFS